MTPAGIEPATFRFVSQHLNHCATAVPQGEERKDNIKVDPKYRGYECLRWLHVGNTSVYEIVFSSTGSASTARLIVLGLINIIVHASLS